MPNRFTTIEKKRGSKQNRYYVNVVYPEIPLSSDDVYIMSKGGDRLDNLAFEFYNDLTLWWVISIANPDKIKRDTFVVKPGLQIRIPTDITSILNSYEQINESR
jgi:nucleoid-associated protein YgaU